MSRVIALTGGIGSGKSTVASVLRAMGYPVYDCDRQARLLMDCSKTIAEEIRCRVCADAICPIGTIDRPRLAEVVFADETKLRELNRIVHAAVGADISAWIELQTTRPVFVETAIPNSSGLVDMVGCEWRVDAPRELKIQRIKKRNGLSRREIEQRIAAQHLDEECHHPLTYHIQNDNIHPLLPQIEQLLEPQDYDTERDS